MKKNFILIGAFAFCAATMAQNNPGMAVDRKWDGGIERLIKGQPAQGPVTLGVKNNTIGKESVARVIIQADEAQSVARALSGKGYEATVISDELLTAEVPVAGILTLAEMPEVTYIRTPRTFRPLLKEARRLSSVDNVHKGQGLETPFTGKGVIMGVIDQGFEYKHVAFLDKDGNSRVRALWNRNAGTDPVTKIPSGGDGMDTNGHGTHVACIAAGSNVGENGFYGMAPDAELIIIPSKFTEKEVLEDAKYIADFARKEDKPFVINMSFGSQVGAHDGLSAYDRAMSGLCGAGALMVAAMGNEGQQRIHASHTFTEDGSVRLLLSIPEETSNKFNYVDIWGDATDGKNHLTIKPFAYSNKKIDYKTTSFWKDCGVIDSKIDPDSYKENYTCQVNLSLLSTLTGQDRVQYGIEISGKKGDSFHAWVNPPYGEFVQPPLTSGFLKGDWEYCVGEGAACVPAAISVASYNSAISFQGVDGNTYNYPSIRKVGEISYFSSHGPSLGDDPKPTVAAPGAAVISALSKYSPGFNRNDGSLASIVSRGLQKYYYGAMTGTSMASPAVAGIMALWLEAFPKLTPEQAKDILRTTSGKDNYTGAEAWNSVYGYGKINAYAGLKEALKLAKETGINEMLNSEAPVTLSMGPSEWRVLFNNDESYADISFYSANGRQVGRDYLRNVRRGDERTIDLGQFTPGVYLMCITTTSSTMTRKVVVR